MFWLMSCMLVQHYGRSDVMSSLENIPAGDAADTDTRKLVILGLPWDTTKASLEQYFSQIGPLQVRFLETDSRPLCSLGVSQAHDSQQSCSK